MHAYGMVSQLDDCWVFEMQQWISCNAILVALKK